MAFVSTKTLKYLKHEEELLVLGTLLDCLMAKDIEGAIHIAISRQDALLASQAPCLMDYTGGVQ